MQLRPMAAWDGLSGVSAALKRCATRSHLPQEDVETEILRPAMKNAGSQDDN